MSDHDALRRLARLQMLVAGIIKNHDLNKASDLNGIDIVDLIPQHITADEIRSLIIAIEPSINTRETDVSTTTNDDKDLNLFRRNVMNLLIGIEQTTDPNTTEMVQVLLDATDKLFETQKKQSRKLRLLQNRFELFVKMISNSSRNNYGLALDIHEMKMKQSARSSAGRTRRS